MSYHKPCRPSFLQYLALREAYFQMQKAQAAAGPTAKKRFDKWVADGAKP